MKGCFRVVGLVVAVAVMLCVVASPARSGAGDFLFSKKLHGMFAAGAGGLLLKASWDAKKDANDSYDLYQLSASSTTARDLYDESKRQDTRSLLMLGAGVGSLLLAVHLFLDEDEDLPMPEKTGSLVEVKGIKLDVKGDPIMRTMRVQLKKGF